SDTYNVTADLDIVRNAGEAFGEFQMLLADYDASKLSETIPGFHDTRKRFEKLWEDVKLDPQGRVADVREELDWLRVAEDRACRLIDLHRAGKIPLRVTHNDTKINNVLFDKVTKEPLVVIDLDTAMPGIVGNDFGDAIRFAANYVEEDCKNLEFVGVNMNVYSAFTEGFLKYTAKALTDAEIDTLALSSFAITVELATRFLDDYILGDPYFHINYPDHNLVRTRCQIALAKDMLVKMDEMEKTVRDCVKKYK
ncbi:MAG: aminoglycoside phosphotransferase family protein, partial [Lachnospiraceae bacterium]|nr:aminoglycoside phosphotransferase family protein [Lachnospiraceae bacterium]